MAPKARLFENATKDPIKTQRKLLLKYIVDPYWIGSAVKRFQEIAPASDRTLNRHRWTGRVYQGA